VKSVKHRLYLSDWFVNAGLLGFYRVLSQYHPLPPQQINQNYLEFSATVFEKFSEHFIEALIAKFSKYEQDRVWMDRRLNWALNPDRWKDSKDAIFRTIKSTLDKVKKKVDQKILTEDVLHKLDQLNKSKRNVKEHPDLKKVVDEYLQVLKQEKVNEEITLNYVRSSLSKLFGQPSFLNPSFTGDKKSVVDKFHKDYVIPVIQECEFMEWLQTAPTDSLDKALKKEKKRSNYFNQMQKHYKQYGEFLPCSIFGNDFVGFQQIEEMHFIPLGISTKINNFFWNGRETTLISNIARLVLFCIPLGVVSFQKKEQDYHQISDGSWVERFGFVNADASLEELKHINENFAIKKDSNHPFTELMYDLLAETQDLASWILENILYVEFSSEGKGIHLEYFQLPQVLAEFFVGSSRSGKFFKYINDRYFRNQIIQAILVRKEPYNLIYNHLRKQIKEGKPASDCYWSLIIYHRLKSFLMRRQNLSLGGQKKMIARKLDKVFKEGEAIAQYFRDNKKENQLPGLSYRLMNACKSGNKQQFFDSMLRIYMSAQRKVDDLIINVFHERDLDFTEFGYTFVAGLQSEGKQEEKDKKSGGEKQ
jgi:CRISPR-associated protein Cst1